VGPVAGKEKMRNTYRILVRTHQRKRPCERPRSYRNRLWRWGQNWTGSG